jgi:hypothetical protein
VKVGRALTVVGCALAFSPLPLTEEERLSLKKRSGGIRVPKDYKDIIEKVVNDAFDKLDRKLQKLNVVVDILGLDLIQEFEPKLIRDITGMASRWSKMKPEDFKVGTALDDLRVEVAGQFRWIKSLFPHYDIPLNTDCEMVIDWAGIDVEANLCKVVGGWKWHTDL